MTDHDPQGLDQVDRPGRAAAAAALDAFGQVPPFEPADAASTRRRSPVLVAAALVLVLAVGAAAIALLVDDGEGQPVATDDGAGDVGQPLAPTYLPDGLELVTVSPPGPGRREDGGPIGLVRSDVDDPYDHELFVLHRVTGSHRFVADATPVDLGGIDGWLGDGGIQGLWWEESGSTMLLLALDRDHGDQLVELGQGLVAASRDEDRGAVPTGWSGLHLEPDDAGRLMYSSADSVELEVHLFPGDEVRLFAMAVNRAECEREATEWCGSEIRVRGVWAEVTTDPNTRWTTLSWSDPSGWSVLLRSTLSVGELERIADGFEPTTWEELLAQVLDDDSLPPVSEVDPDSPPDPDQLAAVHRLVGSPDLQVRPVLDQRRLGPDDPEWPSRIFGLEPPDRPVLVVGEDTRDLYELGGTVLDGTSVSGLLLSRDQLMEQWVVEVQLDDVGRLAFDELATTCIERSPSCPTGQIALVWEGRVVSAPMVQATEFVETITITGESLDLFQPEP